MKQNVFPDLNEVISEQFLRYLQDEKPWDSEYSVYGQTMSVTGIIWISLLFRIAKMKSVYILPVYKEDHISNRTNQQQNSHAQPRCFHSCELFERLFHTKVTQVGWCILLAHMVHQFAWSSVETNTRRTNGESSNGWCWLGTPGLLHDLFSKHWCCQPKLSYILTDEAFMRYSKGTWKYLSRVFRSMDTWRQIGSEFD